MNKQDITIVALLIALLFGWFHFQSKANRERVAAWEREQAAIAATNEVGRAAISAESAAAAGMSAADEKQEGPSAAGAGEDMAPAAEPQDDAEGEPEDAEPAETALLDNGKLALSVSGRGAAIVSAELSGYRASLEKDSPDIVFDYGDSPALGIDGWKGFGVKSRFELVSSGETNAVFRRTLADGATLTRSLSLGDGYVVTATDTLTAGEKPLSLPGALVNVGGLRRQSRGNTSVLSVDNLPRQADGREKVVNWERKHMLANLFTGGRGGGCAGAPDAAQFPHSAGKFIDAPQKWVAVKTRFFAQILECDAAGFRVDARRATEAGPLRIESVGAAVAVGGAELAAGASVSRTYRLYIGPKKLSVIRRFAEKSGDIMEFGMSKWLCVILLPILNFLNGVFHNYGVAIIVLTIMVRLIFWPLTRKSNESMKKMGAIQPQIKEIQAKFKDDPQKLQQETMRLYRENHVNPMSSCLPMLIQIPVFIALFVVLRTATELRFAPFLWIRDLSEPENLLAGAIPGVPALNILPFVMAGTMFLQSKLTPSMGDPSQQRMMMWMMPLMMFFMFYSMPSALLLYWSVSQLLAIFQLLRQRRARAVADGASANPASSAPTRQERRRLERDGAGR